MIDGMSARTTSRPAPTPVSRLGAVFERQYKYHPARPYRWWELRPTPPEAPEVFYSRIESHEEYRARLRAPRGFWTYVREWILGFVLLLLFGAWLKLLIDGLQ